MKVKDMEKDMTEKNDTCVSCNSQLESIGFRGDWEIFECTGESCNLKVHRSVSNPSGDGYTMEDLKNLSDIDWS